MVWVTYRACWVGKRISQYLSSQISVDDSISLKILHKDNNDQWPEGDSGVNDYIWTYSTPFTIVSIVDFEQVNNVYWIFLMLRLAEIHSKLVKFSQYFNVYSQYREILVFDQLYCFTKPWFFFITETLLLIFVWAKLLS